MYNTLDASNTNRLTGITYPSGYVLTYNYSSGLNSDISRLSSLSDTGGTLESYDYLGLGTVVRRAHPGPGVELTFIGSGTADARDQYIGLDRFGRVVDQEWKLTGTSTVLDEATYAYDRNGNRTAEGNGVNSAFNETYAYDGLNQLTGFDRGSGTHTQAFDYDAVGNRDSVTTDGGTPQTYTANKQNEITSVNGATTPTYDANGNMTINETGRQFVYDAWNKLKVVKDSGGSTLKTYAYDGLGRRVSETASGTTTDLYYSAQWQVLEERVGGVARASYVWSPVYVDAMILRDRDTDANGSLDERLYVIQDANFNVTALVNASGVVVERYVYDAYGAVTVLDASWAVQSGGSNYAWVHLHQGGRLDATSGLYHFRNRDYSPALGRFNRNDPLGWITFDLNYYRGLENNPIINSDPNGLQINPNVIIPTIPNPARDRRSTLEKFNDWYKANKDTSWTKKLPDCPCRINLKERKTTFCVTTSGATQPGGGTPITITSIDAENPDPKVWDNPKRWQLDALRAIGKDYHPGAVYDMRSRENGILGKPGQQCTYDANGNLITHGPGAGTPDKINSGNGGHGAADVAPYDWALELDGKKPGRYVQLYLEVRPPNQGKGCAKNPKDPRDGARMDPRDYPGFAGPPSSNKR